VWWRRREVSGATIRRTDPLDLAARLGANPERLLRYRSANLPVAHKGGDGLWQQPTSGMFSVSFRPVRPHSTR
jgi:hypothetical protein